MANQQVDQRLAAVIKDAAIACERAGRSDLKERVERLGTANQQASSSIVVIGEFRVGKGSTINALLGARVCPTASGLEPHGPIRISYGDPATARVWSPGATTPTLSTPAAVAAGQYPDELCIKGLGPIDVELPHAALRSGLTFVDTPSSGGVSSFKAVADLELVRQADAVLFVTSAAQPLTRSEIGAIETLSLLCPLVTVVLNKIDYYPAWREIRSIDDHALREAGLTARVVPISAMLALSAGKDQELLAESGVPVLGKYIREQVIDAIAARRRQETADALLAVLEQVESPLTAELRALEDPDSAAATVRTIEQEYEELDRIRRSTAGWQTVLADSFDDLVSGAERQLREDFSAMIRDSEQAINEQDPREIWSEMQSFAVQRCTWILARTLDVVATTCHDINSEVASRFGGTGADVAPLGASGATRSPDPDQMPSSAIVDVRFDRSSRKDRLFVGFRGVVGGLTMFSVLGSFVFPPLITVAPIGAVVMGRKVIAEDRERMLERSRAAARTAIRRYCDDALRAASADIRQIAKEYRRELRDHYAGRADETARTLTRQLDALRETKQRAKAEHAARAGEVRKEVGRIQALRGIVDKLAVPAPLPPPTMPTKGVPDAGR